MLHMQPLQLMIGAILGSSGNMQETWLVRGTIYMVHCGTCTI